MSGAAGARAAGAEARATGADAAGDARDRRDHAAARLLATLAVALVCLLALAMIALRLAGWQPLAVLSGSMAPTLREGDLIVVEQVRASTVAPGDVIAFARPRHPGETLTHRVVTVRRGRGGADGALAVTTRGDANPAPERWMIAADGRVGLLRARLPRVGVLVAPMRGELSRSAAILGATGLAAAAALWLIWRPRRREEAAR